MNDQLGLGRRVLLALYKGQGPLRLCAHQYASCFPLVDAR